VKNLLVIFVLYAVKLQFGAGKIVVLSDFLTKSVFGCGSARTPLGKLTTLPLTS